MKNFIIKRSEINEKDIKAEEHKLFLTTTIPTTTTNKNDSRAKSPHKCMCSEIAKFNYPRTILS